MKIIVLLLVACIAFSMVDANTRRPRAMAKRAYYHETCPVYSCVGTNDACGFVDLVKSEDITACKDLENLCYVTETGDNYEKGTCVAYPTNGEKCLQQNGDDFCAKGFVCSSLTGTCIVDTTNSTATAQPGQACGPNVECQFYNYTSFTQEHVCNDGVCKFIPDGQQCSSYTQCNQVTESDCTYDATRMASYCTSPLAQGAVCNLNYSISTASCANYMNCVPDTPTNTAGTCQYIYSQKSGHACNDDSDCSKGFCGSPPFLQLFGTCVAFTKTSTRNQGCTTDNDCTTSNGEQCVCSGDSDGSSKCRVLEFDSKYASTLVQREQCNEEGQAKCGDLDYTTVQCWFDTCGKKTWCGQYEEERSAGAVTYDDDEQYLACFNAEKCDAAALLASLPILVVVAIIALFLQ